MLRLLVTLPPTLRSAMRSRHDLVVENLALRQQLVTLAARTSPSSGPTRSCAGTAPTSASIEGALTGSQARGGRGVLDEPTERPDGTEVELTVVDDVQHEREWRVMCYVVRHAIAVLDVVAKSTGATPCDVIANCRRRLAQFRKVDAS